MSKTVNSDKTEATVEKSVDVLSPTAGIDEPVALPGDSTDAVVETEKVEV